MHASHSQQRSIETGRAGGDYVERLLEGTERSGVEVTTATSDKGGWAGLARTHISTPWPFWLKEFVVCPEVFPSLPPFDKIFGLCGFLVAFLISRRCHICGLGFGGPPESHR